MLMQVPRFKDISASMRATNRAIESKRARTLSELADDVNYYRINWTVVLEDIIEEGYSREEISFSLGMSATWVCHSIKNGTKKMDYAIGTALKKMHRKVCGEEMHMQVFGHEYTEEEK